MHLLDPFFLDQVMVLEDSSHIRWSYLGKHVLHSQLH